jgi:hypothetical protein
VADALELQAEPTVGAAGVAQIAAERTVLSAAGAVGGLVLAVNAEQQAGVVERCWPRLCLRRPTQK